MDETIRILPWTDPVIDTLGHDPRAPYPEKFWLPTLGPSALFLIRHLADRFDAEPAGFDLALAEVSRCLGLGDRVGRSSTVARSLGRLVQFDLATYPEDDAGGGGAGGRGVGVLHVRRHVPPINRRHLHRLPPSRQAEHDAWVSARLAEPAMAAARQNARRAAVVLSAMGERPDAVERALGRAGFAPMLARDAALWAADQLAAVPPAAQAEAPPAPVAVAAAPVAPVAPAPVAVAPAAAAAAAAAA